ncbi:MAG: hypothetical protein NC548_42110 [Lachnospiraceae bacterium]|nr:hypothetical protein [Lachnospiraceae bacterium]
MKIGLVDVDGHNFPNFALMRIAGWHKSRGDEVEMAMPLFGDYDRVYQSKIFTFSPEKKDFDNLCEVVRGGTGYDIKSQLPEEIEKSSLMDYSIYPPYTTFPYNSFQGVAYGSVRFASSEKRKDIYTPSSLCNLIPMATISRYWIITSLPIPNGNLPLTTSSNKIRKSICMELT